MHTIEHAGYYRIREIRFKLIYRISGVEQMQKRNSYARHPEIASLSVQGSIKPKLQIYSRVHSTKLKV
jgi:hypothetical protein